MSCGLCCHRQRWLGSTVRYATPPPNVEDTCLEALAHQAVNPAGELKRMFTGQRCWLHNDNVDDPIVEIIPRVPALMRDESHAVTA